MKSLSKLQKGIVNNMKKKFDDVQEKPLQPEIKKVTLKNIQEQKSDELVDRVMQKILKIKD